MKETAARARAALLMTLTTANKNRDVSKDNISGNKSCESESEDTDCSSVSSLGASGPPAFLQRMVDCTAFPGDCVRFDVRVSGCRPRDLRWLRDDEEVEEDASHVVEVSRGAASLIVRRVTEDDEGEYTCRACNAHGTVACSADLTVYGTGEV